MLSVVIPVFNAEDTIERCIKSIQLQPLFDIEIIVIDDASTDHTSDVCSKIIKKDKRVKYYSFTKNSGVSAARNEGVRRSNGEWIMFVDADDRLCENALDDFSDNDWADLIIYDFCFCKDPEVEQMKTLPLPESKLTSKDIPELLHLCAYHSGFHVKDWNIGAGAPWGKIYKKSILTDNSFLFNETLKRGEDVLFNLNVYSVCEEILYKSKSLYIYCLDDSSSSSSYHSDADLQASITFSEFKKMISGRVIFSNLLKDIDYMGIQLDIFAIKNKFLIEKNYNSLRRFLVDTEVGRCLSWKNLVRFNFYFFCWIFFIKLNLYYLLNS
ncbi:glycosyltransferase family 2 protein [Bifidobacterium longum]|uniref:glycosyltransferase family 2 protein n=1 Tax=Bifidobacterium longum TaxID=216816 RepID=UPI000C31910A|nr:glycosyltransferase family 2 protein [Bifidobacterium longum]PKD10921.1 glycosyltransferase [Bifidobacterium longum]